VSRTIQFWLHLRPGKLSSLTDIVSYLKPKRSILKTLPFSKIAGTIDLHPQSLGQI
jgi:hypothetical protein